MKNTHTLRHVLGSNPGGKLPLKIGSICKLKDGGKSKIYPKYGPVMEVSTRALRVSILNPRATCHNQKTNK